MSERIRDKVVIITGASAGMGQATARHLAARGAKLVLAARRIDRLTALVEDLGLDPRAAVETDVSRHADVVRMVERAIELYGRIDVLLNNAGVMPHSLLEQNKVEDWDRTIDVNLKGTLYGIGAVLPYMKAQKSGLIINVSSVAGHKVRPPGAVYSATKVAVRMLTEGLRQEVKPYNIRTTILSPGMIDTDLIDSVTEAVIADGMRSAYAQTAITSDSLAWLVAFVMEQPDFLDLNEILFRPTAQEY